MYENQQPERKVLPTLRIKENLNEIIEPPKFMSPRVLQESKGDIDEDFRELDLEL